VALTKIIRNVLEKAFGRFYEGPECPERIADEAVEFANRNPIATREDWVIFAQDLAREAYKSGWQRGFEHVERAETRFPWQEGMPDDIANGVDPDWRANTSGIDLHNPHGPVLVEEEAMGDDD